MATASKPSELNESYLERAISASSHTPEETTKGLLSVLTSQAIEGTVKWDKNLTLTIETAINQIDGKISEQLSTIMQDNTFKKLEGSWLGLKKLITNSESGVGIKFKLADFTKEELLEHFEDAPAIDRSNFFTQVYQKEFGTAGGQPYSALIGDYEFGYHDEDVALLRYIAEVASSAHAPFVAAVNEGMFDYSSFTQFDEGKPVYAGFESPVYSSWNAFRDHEDSRYVALTLPRTLARLPYGSKSIQVSAFQYEELMLREDGTSIVQSNDDFVWSNSAYEYGLILCKAFAKYGWCTAVRGVENGGKAVDLPNYMFTNDSSELVQQCPTEINLTDEREKELSDLGFLPVVHFKNTNFGVFIGGQTAHRPKTYNDPDATANSAISARLPYTMASSRIAQYLKVIGREKIGSNISPDGVERELTSWINRYVNGNAVSNEAKAKTPLMEAKVTVEEQVGRPGAYSAVAYLRPWLQLEELSTSLRMVANIPS